MVAGIAGTELTAESLASLPASAPPAPWALEARAIVWLAPPTRAARAARQPGVTGRVLATGGAFIAYADTPVGPYDEVIGFLVLGGRGGAPAHIPFIAVDSPASVVGGRANWWLPKTLARFHGTPATSEGMTAEHPAWRVAARARAAGPALPLTARFALRQADAAGIALSARGRARVRVRPALVSVTTSGTAALTDWLRTGRFPGMVIDAFSGSLGPAARSQGSVNAPSATATADPATVTRSSES